MTARKEMVLWNQLRAVIQFGGKKRFTQDYLLRVMQSMEEVQKPKEEVK